MTAEHQVHVAAALRRIPAPGGRFVGQLYQPIVGEHVWLLCDYTRGASRVGFTD